MSSHLRSFKWQFWAAFLLIFQLAKQVESQCFVDDPTKPNFKGTAAFSTNETMESTDECKKQCSKIRFPYAAILNASYCFCGSDISGLTASSSCSATCSDGSECGGENSITVIETGEKPAEEGSISVTPLVKQEVVLVGDTVTVMVNASEDYAIYWGDGSTPTLADKEHIFNLPGVYIATAFLEKKEKFQSSTYFVVHDLPNYNVSCPNSFEIGVPQECKVVSFRQGYDYILSWNITNSTFTKTFFAEIPSEEISVYGTASITTDTMQDSDVTTGTLIVLSNSKNQIGGQLVRIKGTFSATGSIAVYAITPSCSSGEYCGISETCRETTTCLAHDNPLTCGNFCPAKASCKASCTSDVAPATTFSFKLLAKIEVTETNFDYDIEFPSNVQFGTQLAIGCAATADCPSGEAVLKMRALGVGEVNETRFNTADNSFLSAPNRHIIQLVVRSHVHIDLSFNVTCTDAAPYPKSDVPMPYSEATEIYVYNGSLQLQYRIYSILAVSPAKESLSLICQEEILEPTVIIRDIWIKYGEPYENFTIYFTQGSPIFTIIDFGDGTMFYDYMDKFNGGWNMSLTLNYTDEGVFLLFGNSTNALGSVFFNATIHVVPPVTDTWTGVFECTCLDITEGFNLTLNFPSASHPPWNATFNATYVKEDGSTVILFDEFLDFETYGANGAAVPLLIQRKTQILEAGTYNVTIFLENEVSFTTFIVQVTVEEALRNISGILKQNYSGDLVEGMDAQNMTFLADHDIYVYPSALSGTPDVWRIVVNETNEVFYIKPTENFTLNFPDEGTYTLIISGNNSVQGWVDSEPITITIEEPIRKVNATLKWEREKVLVEGVGPDKNTFMAGNPIYIYPFVETGYPDKWLLVINETGESFPLDASTNFTTITLPEGNYTLIVKGYNPIQGWVESQPIPFIVQEAISNVTGTVMHCNGSQTIEGMGPDKNIFLAGFPLCINVSRETGTPEYWKLHIMNESYDDLFLPFPESIFNLTLDEEGNYTIILSANNSIQGWVDSKPITIIIQKPITGVNATLKWEREGVLVDGVGPNKNTYMSFIPLHIFPELMTGYTDKWRLIIIDSGQSPIEISPEKNFTTKLPQGNYTVIVSGFNPIQGWVDSDPIPIIVEEAISDVNGTVMHCNGSETIEGMGEDKNVFIAGYPLCIYPNVQTGKPFFWKVEANETDYSDEMPFKNTNTDYFNTSSFITEGKYTLFVSANNSVQGWVRSLPIPIIIEDPITGVNATLKWEREGALVDGVGPNKNTYMSFIPIHIFPESMTGHADKWRLIIIDDGKSPIEITATQNFTTKLPQGNYTVIVSGFNPIQGWINSDPIPIIVEEAISNVNGTVLHCNGSETIEGMGEDKNVFIAGYPLCIYPNIQTGTPYNWKIFVNETSYVEFLPFKNISTDFFNLTTLTTEGTYILIVSANNSIQGWVDSLPITIIIEDPITEVKGTVKLERSDGELVDGVGPKKNIYIANNPIHVFPTCLTGHADKWRLIVMDDGKPPQETDSPSKNFTLTDLPKGNYTLLVSGFNPIQGWVHSDLMEIVIEESLSGVSAIFKWESEDGLVDGMGNDRNVFMANKTIYVYPTVKTGDPDFYKIRINETSGCNIVGKAERPANENFTIFCDGEGDYTLIISAKNSLQGWVESEPLIIGVANEIRGFVLKDNNDITQEGEEKIIIGYFEKFTPKSCILVDFGDGSTWELYGDKEICDAVDYKDGEKYEYKGPEGSFTMPVNMPHVYQKKGTYNVMAYASDNKGNNQFSEISVTVDTVPCTMPIVEIVDGVRVIDSPSISEIQMSFYKELTTEARFECKNPYNFKRMWEVFQVDPETGLIIRTVTVEDVLSSWNMSTIVIPPRFLSEGLYKLKHTLDIYPSPDKILKRSDYTYIRIIPSPLRPILIAGSAMKVKRGLGQFVYLQASLSYDPDYPDDEIKNKSLSCRQVAPNPDAAEGCLKTNAAEDALSSEDHYLDTLDFIKNKGTYEIRLDVQKGSRQGFTILIIEVVFDPLPIMQITCMKGLCIDTEQGLYFSPNKRLALIGSCLDYCGIELSYSWLITSVNGDQIVISDVCGTGMLSAEGSVIEMREDCEEAYLTPRNTSAIAVSKKFFEDNPNVKEFIFTVTGTTEKGYEGSTQILLKKNMPPNCGKCELYPPKGEDRYPVFCNNPNWIDPEGMGISSYTYYYLENSPNGPVKKTIVSTIKHSLELILPVGSYELLVEISDVLGATTNHSIGVVNITTAKDPDPDSWIDLAAKDKTELWMKLMQYSSIRDTSKNYSLNPEDIANMTQEEIEGRIRKLANLNTLASGLLTNTSSLMTMKDINAATSILRCLMDPVYKEQLYSQTWDMNGIDNVMKLLFKINSTIPKLNVSSPGEYLPFMPQYLDIMGASMISMGNNMGDEINFCPPTDMDYAPFMEYDLGAISKDTEIPDNQEDMYCNTIRDSIKYKALAQVKDMESMLNYRLDDISEISVPGETFRCTSPNGVSLVLSKIMELVLKGGLNITAKFSSKAGVMFPANFCPSMYKIPDTDCNQVLSIKCIVWPCITHMYPDTTKILSKSTRILDLDIIINKDRVDVKNESNPIRMNIPRELDTTPQYNNVNASLELNRHVPFVYHSFNVTYEKSSITIEIRSLGPQEDLNNVVLLLDHNDTMPTPTKYWKIKKVQELEKDENDTYKYFISSDENENRTGRFFAAIAKLDKSFENVPDIENLTFSKSDFVKDFDLIYSFSAYTSGCYFFNDLALEWSGRDLYVESASPDNIQCASHHLTPFGFGFTPTINSVDFEFIFSNAGFVDNLTIYIVLIVLGCLFIFMIIWAFFKDRKDIERRGVIPLPDNKPEDKYLYELSFRTGPDDQASTDSNIYIIVSGECGETEVRVLPPANNRLYRRFEVNTFVMTTPKPLGKLNYLRVFHDNSGEPPLDGWQLEMVVVRDLQLHEKYIFDINDWLAFYRSDGKIDKTFTVYEGKDEKTFTQNMYVRGNRAANEDHMWFSIFLRSNGSRYDRKERVTVSFAFLFLSMLVDAVWYDMTKESSREGNFNLGPFTFSLEQLLTGLCIVCVIFPVMYLVTLIFKRARPRNLKKCRAIESIQNQRAEQRNVEKETAFEDEKIRVQVDEGRPPKPKDVSQIKCIPWWTRIFAWFFVIASIGVSGFFVWSYGIMWNETKTAKWFSSFILTFFLSILVAQWVKVAVISLISATCCKEDLTVQDIDCDEELPVLKQNEEWQYQRQLDPTMRKKVHRVIGVDIENKETKSIQERMQKEYQIGHVLRGILIYCIFLAIVLTLVNGRTDYNAFLFQQHMTQVFIKDGVLDYDFEAKVKTSNEYWLWAKSILSELRAQDWYNGAPPYGLRGFLNDRASRIMGYAIIRQVRTKRYKCEVPSPVDTEIEHCSGVRSPFREEEQSFCVGWIFNETFPGSCDWEEYQHKTAGELGTYPYTGKLGVYGGGGYVIRLNGYQADLSNRLDQLQQNNWIDKNTRAVFLEFSVYNANVNLFCMCTVLCEFIDGGGLMPKWRFEPVRLIKDTGVKGLITTICELGFAAATIFFTFRELWEIKKMKLKYFISYWNLAEMCIVIISYLAIGMYIYRTILTQEALDKFNETNGNGYVRMDSAAFVDQVFVYAAAAVVFFSTIKLIKLLQFNNRFNMLGLTIRGCWEDLKMFFVAFAIIFFAFSCLFFFMFTAHLEEFAKIISAIQTSFQMMMGKFEFEAMKNINFFSPLLFFVFSVINSMILINVMLTIILQAFADVKMDLANKQNRLDVINHVWISFKRFIRKEQLPKINVQPNFNDKEDGRYGGQYGERKSDNLPDKVSMLLKYINDVYFDGRLDLNDPYAKKALMSGTMSEKMLPFHDPTTFGKRTIKNSDEQ